MCTIGYSFILSWKCAQRTFDVCVCVCYCYYGACIQSSMHKLFLHSCSSTLRYNIKVGYTVITLPYICLRITRTPRIRHQLLTLSSSSPLESRPLVCQHQGLKHNEIACIKQSNFKLQNNYREIVFC